MKLLAKAGVVKKDGIVVSYSITKNEKEFEASFTIGDKTISNSFTSDNTALIWLERNLTHLSERGCSYYEDFYD